jgi:hypothetical protein
MEDVVASGVVPGLLAYRGGQAVGWVAVSSRDELVRLEHSLGFVLLAVSLRMRARPVHS